jgi:hypothetical protein
MSEQKAPNPAEGIQRVVASMQKSLQEGVGPLIAEVARQEEAQHWPGSAGAVWQAHAALVADLLVRKSAYGDAWKEQGYMGNVGRILSKATRLRNMAWTDSEDTAVDPDDESVLDTLLDLSALCAFAIANIEEENKWGR